MDENLQDFSSLLKFLDSVAVDTKVNGECECLAAKNGDLIDLQNDVESYVRDEIN